MRNSFSFLGIILLYLICSLSCSKQTETGVKLRAIESYIQENPLLALEELYRNSLDLASLKAKDEATPDLGLRAFVWNVEESC